MRPKNLLLLSPSLGPSTDAAVSVPVLETDIPVAPLSMSHQEDPVDPGLADVVMDQDVVASCVANGSVDTDDNVSMSTLSGPIEKGLPGVSSDVIAVAENVNACPVVSSSSVAHSPDYVVEDTSANLAAQAAHLQSSTLPLDVSPAPCPSEVAADASPDILHISASSSCVVALGDHDPTHPTRTSSYSTPPRLSHPRKEQLFYSALALTGFREGIINPESVSIYGDMVDFTFGKHLNGGHHERRRRVLQVANSQSHWSRAPYSTPDRSASVRVDPRPAESQTYSFDDTPSLIQRSATVDGRTGFIPHSVSATSSSVVGAPTVAPVLSACDDQPPENSRRPVKQHRRKPRQRRVPASAQSCRLKDMSDRDLVDLLYPSDAPAPVARTVAHIKAASASKLERCPKDKIVADIGATHKMWNCFEDFHTFCRLFGQFFSFHQVVSA